ncbi:hypothetical protein [Roseomonas indoligenes]|uniref:Lipoprotein n=1 Tax=Roseomonas indoligenes TaxID=2820811 RepID=A0A940S633_9PROT|nr:hypothetical protein [Pararoseomonas indoligenes]MBP0493555.1 hypothetical protein [Pararoseomonas indoligenes]
MTATLSLPRAASAVILLGLLAACSNDAAPGRASAPPPPGLTNSGMNTPQPAEQRAGTLPSGNSTNPGTSANTR